MESTSSDEIIFEEESKTFYPDDFNSKTGVSKVQHDDERIKTTKIEAHDENNNNSRESKVTIRRSNNRRDNSIIGMLRSTLSFPKYNNSKPKDKQSGKDNKQQKSNQKSTLEKVVDELDDDNLLSDNKVNVDIVPDVEGNNVVVNLCSCSCAFNFSMYK